MTLYTLQLLRFFAAMLVLFFHLWLSSSGYKGVDIFFVISGFIMYYTLIYNRPPGIFKFVVHRLSKIFFLYWIALIFLYAIVPFQIKHSFFKTLFLIPGHDSLLGISWSLSYELYFYFIIGIVVYSMPKKYYNRIFVLLFLIATCITILNLSRLTLKNTTINFLFGANFWEFLLGVFSGYSATIYKKVITPRIALYATLLSFLLLLFIAIPYTRPISYIVYGILSFFIVFFIAIYDQNSHSNRQDLKIFKILGDASYAIYLFGPIVTIVITTQNQYAKILIIITTIVSSILFNQLIETNSLRWIRKKILQRGMI